jgi:hypothetical protein
MFVVNKNNQLLCHPFGFPFEGVAEKGNPKGTNAINNVVKRYN